MNTVQKHITFQEQSERYTHHHNDIFIVKVWYKLCHSDILCRQSNIWTHSDRQINFLYYFLSGQYVNIIQVYTVRMTSVKVTYMLQSRLYHL